MADHGITPEQYDAMLEAQGGVCAICGGANPDGRNLAVDHNHAAGRLRKLLCNLCNRGLGCFKDNPARLRSAQTYLEETDRDHEREPDITNANRTYLITNPS